MTKTFQNGFYKMAFAEEVFANIKYPRFYKIRINKRGQPSLSGTKIKFFFQIFSCHIFPLVSIQILYTSSFIVLIFYLLRAKRFYEQNSSKTDSINLLSPKKF